jgi:hypothetical protein
VSAARRAHAPVPPRRPHPRPREPRQPAVPGRVPSPGRRRSRDASTAPCHVPPRRRVVRAPRMRRTAGPSEARPYARRPRSAVARRNLGPRHPAVTVGRLRDLYKAPASSLCPHSRATPPSAPPPSSCAPHCLPQSSNRPYPFPRPYRTVACHLLSGPSPCHRRSRAATAPPPVLAVRPRRHILRPNSGHPQALGEHTVVPRRFPGREHGQLAGIRPAPPPPMAKALIASP